MIHARGLTKSYGKHVILEGVNLDIERGDRVAVVGLNGAGKTTFFRCLLGVTSFQGMLTVGGCDVTSDGRGARSHIGYVPQRAPHFDGTLEEMIDFFCRLRGTPVDNVVERLADVALDFDAHRDKLVRELSGGMLQKVLLALALAAEVSVLLLDEPTANLDPRARREFLRALRAVPRETTILLSSHQLADIEAVTNRVLVLHEREFAFTGTLSELASRLSDDIALWLDVPREQQKAARDALEASSHVTGIIGINGSVGVRVPRRFGADVVHEVRSKHVRVNDFWVERPSIEDLLEDLLTGGKGS